MTFVPVPNASDPSLSSQQQLQINFQQINSIFGENHKALFNCPLDDLGRHTGILLDKQASDPTILADEVALYSKLGTGGIPQLFFKPTTLGDPIQMTYQNTGQFNGSVNVTSFSGATATTVVVNTAGNSFVVGDIVIFDGLEGDAAANGNIQGTVTVAGNSFTINTGDATAINGSLTKGTVGRNVFNCVTYFPGPYVVLFGIIKNLTYDQVVTYSDYYPPNITFSEAPFIILNPTDCTTRTITTTSFIFRSSNPSPSVKTDVNYLIIGKTA